jgi:hypothetical protein
MADETELTPLDDRGEQLFDGLETACQIPPWRTNATTGVRIYHLKAQMAETMLDELDSTWRDHLTPQ